MSASHDRMHSHDIPTHAAFNALDWIAMALMVVGGLNWGLVGIADLDLVAALLGEMSPATRGIYVLVGLAGLYGIVMFMKMARSRKA